METTERVKDIPTLPKRAEQAHKGTSGRVLIVAGSRTMGGAAVLCGLGALRSGAGLVRVMTAASAHPVVATAEPCLMCAPVSEDGIGELAEPSAYEIDTNWPDVMAVGPGLGQGPSIAGFLFALLQRFQGPTVLDADALNVLARTPAVFARPLAAVLTPHPGEMQRLLDGARIPQKVGETDETRVGPAVAFARQSRAIVVLKGHRTVVTDGQQVFVNTTGNPGMAAGGMGDVLTGCLAALIGQGMSPFDAACLAVHVHGAAADNLAQTQTPIGYLAREVADTLPIAIKSYIA